MSKMVSGVLATCAAAALTAMVALPTAAGAAETRANGITARTGSNVGSLEVSSQRRSYRRGFYGPRYRYGYGYRPYRPYYGYGYGYRPYGGYYRPYYRPAPFFPFF